jgi:tRNA pseudouridine38-40 synthase
MTSKLLLEYDGGGFAGWARQPGERTVQEEVERALSTVLREPVSVVVAGRTDAGVHALGQVCSYEGEAVDPRSLNALLPRDVAVLACEPAAVGFDARRDATSRAYRYRVLTRRSRSAFLEGRALWWPHALDLAALDACAAAVAGVHDFTAFTPTETDHVRFEREVLAAYWERGRGSELDGSDPHGSEAHGPEAHGSDHHGADPAGADPHGAEIAFHIEADAFMRHMNRVLVGTMLEVASGRRELSGFVSLLEGRPRSEAGPTAAACGLYLVGVGYGGERVLGGR